MKHFSKDFDLTTEFAKPIRNPFDQPWIAVDLTTPELLKELEGKKITGLKLKNIGGGQAGDGVCVYLEIITE